jgi:HAT1-interacting factor 1
MSIAEDTTMDPSTTGDNVDTTAPPLSKEELPTKLDDLKASATQQYSLKNYPAAAELYSEAAEVQDQINGEMSPDNADLLYQYGRCLYHVAVSNSDVLGGKVAGEEPKRKKRKMAKSSSTAEASGSGNAVIGDALKDGEQKLAEEVVKAAVEDKEGMKADVKKEGEDTAASKPYFQITGDENWTDSEDEGEDDAAADAEAEEEEDDFAIAYEILDVARVLLTRKLAQEDMQSAELQRLFKERLADTHDLQAEISLENERFHEAIKDTRAALILKTELYPEESSLVAEAHFKLSLALEFASVTSTAEEGDEGKTTAQVDENLRKEAAAAMELAIQSCNARIAKETALLPGLESDPTKKAEQERSIADVKEMVADMQQRLVDLKNPAVSLSGVNATGVGPAGAPDGTDPLRGILGSMLGESKAEQKKRIDEATAGANDLSGMVKRKKVKKEDEASVVEEGKGKRKVDEMDGAAVASNGAGKKVKFAEENGA